MVEEEPGGDERVGEDSQDESATEAPTPVSVTNNTILDIVDEDTLPSSIDGRESPVTAAGGETSALSAIDSESSNDSIDMPLLPARQEPAGTKRKAELLSKDSGKIGVTITTSPSSVSGNSPPPVKIPKLLPIKGTSPTYHVSVFDRQFFFFFSTSKYYFTYGLNFFIYRVTK